MGNPIAKAAVLERIRRERADWEALLAEVGEARMQRPGVAGEWTFKDVAAHLTAWRQRTLARLQAAQRGEAPPPAPWVPDLPEDDDDYEPVNQWIYQRNRARPLADVLRESRESLAQLEAAVQALGDDDLADPQRFAWAGGRSLGQLALGSSTEHFYDEHLADLRAWLANQPG